MTFREQQPDMQEHQPRAAVVGHGPPLQFKTDAPHRRRQLGGARGGSAILG